MAEYILGHEFVREPDRFLGTGDVIEFHTHNHHHNTHVTKGVVEIHRRLRVVSDDGQEVGWQELPLLTIVGGGPRSIVPVPANMQHKLVVLEGPAFYRCCFVHRDLEGNPSEFYHGYEEAYC